MNSTKTWIARLWTTDIMLAAFGLVVRHFGEDGAWAIQESRMSSDANLAIANEPCKSDWFQILKASRQALQPAKLSLAAGGLILTFLLGAALDQVWLGSRPRRGPDLPADPRCRLGG